MKQSMVLVPEFRGQAGVCKFLVTCRTSNAAVNTENVLRDVLTHGLADSEIQLDLLGDINQDMSLEEVFQHYQLWKAMKIPLINSW